MQSLNALMQQLERSPEWRSSTLQRQLLARWPEIVGEAVAQHCQPNKVVRGVLQITVSSPAWAQNLTFERSRLLSKLHQTLPTTTERIRDLRFETATWRRAIPKVPPPPAPALQHHPSWVRSLPLPPSPPPTTAGEAFQQWATRQQAQLAQEGRCPQCRCPCPTQELQRWGKCAICIAQQWHTPQRNTPLR